jgi:hypothetical protein
MPAMTTNLTIDTRGFGAMVAGFEQSLSRLGEMPNTDRILRTLIRRILEGCIRRTKMATAKFIRARFKAKGNSAHAPGIAMSINSGIRGGMEGRVWYGEDPDVSTEVTPKQRDALRRRAKRGGKVWTIMENAIHPGAGMLRRFQALDSLRQADIKGRIRGLMEAALAARGLARNSWYQIAQKLGITLSVTGGAQVAKARPSSGASYEPATGTARYEGPRQLYYDLVNSYPFLRFKIDGAKILPWAIQGEMGYYRNNMAHGVFADLQAIAKKYRGIFG